MSRILIYYMKHSKLYRAERCKSDYKLEIDYMFKDWVDLCIISGNTKNILLNVATTNFNDLFK